MDDLDFLEKQCMKNGTNVPKKVVTRDRKFFFVFLLVHLQGHRYSKMIKDGSHAFPVNHVKSKTSGW